MTICQEGCEFSDYNNQEFIANCSCKVKEYPLSLADMKINKEKLLENFRNIKNIANLNIILCYKKLFKKAGMINNIGCYLLFGINFFHIITIFIFFISDFSLIKKNINYIILGLSHYQLINQDKRQKNLEYKNRNKILPHFNIKGKRRNKKFVMKKITSEDSKKIINNPIKKRNQGTIQINNIKNINNIFCSSNNTTKKNSSKYIIANKKTISNNQRKKIYGNVNKITQEKYKIIRNIMK